MNHIALLMENQPGALSRVIGLFSQRGYNIDSLSVAPTQDETLSRLTMTIGEEGADINQILKQARKNKIENGLFDSEAISTFNTMIDEQYSDILSKKTNFGISDALFNQFKSQVVDERKK